MNRFKCRVLAGLVAATIGFIHIGSAAAADTANKAEPHPPKSPAATAPFVGRIVIRPSPAQMAKLRRERRSVTELGNRARVSRQSGRFHAATIGAL